MHRVSDRQLSEPFRTWIDRDVPLPPGVTVLPRFVSVTGGVLMAVIALMGCVPMALLVPSGAVTEAREWAIIGLIAAAPIGFLAWTLYRLVRMIGARRDQKAGVLRQGILVGPEGLLVRLTPGRCYPVPIDRFLRAEEWSGGGENGSDYLRIVTRDGPIDIWDHDIAADAADVNRAMERARAAGLRTFPPDDTRRTMRCN